MQFTTIFVSALLSAVTLAAPLEQLEKRQTGTGDMTYYAAGLGSCGITNTDADMIVAMSSAIMTPLNGANPNKNPLCGKPIKITYKGKTVNAKVTDSCPGCASGSIDVTPAVFKQFAAESVGRLHGVTWSM